MIINLISSPRNISTALMYSFARRSDTHVMDEPFYGYYLATTGADHPGKDQIMRSQPPHVKGVIDRIQIAEKKANHLFIKNMAHHLIGDDFSFLRNYKNVFLIRDPKLLITSFSKVISNPTMQDIGMKRQWELYEFLSDMDCPVVDSNEILKDPRAILSRLCERLDIPFEPGMLHWQPHQLAEDGIWAKYWYQNVHASSGFSKYHDKQKVLPAHCTALYEESLPYFAQLSQFAIRAPSLS